MTQVCTPIEPAIQPIQPEPSQSIALSQPYRFTVAEYQQIYESGAIAPDARTELIEGIIVKMSPIGFRHQACINRLNRKFCALIQNRAIISVQNSVVLGDSQPQPDLMILQETENFYEDRSPTTAEVLLLIEVADFTAKYDREIKGPLYARSGIGEFWLVDLEHRKLEVYRDPSPEGYQTKFTLAATDQATCLAFPEEPIALGEILG